MAGGSPIDSMGFPYGISSEFSWDFMVIYGDLTINNRDINIFLGVGWTATWRYREEMIEQNQEFRDFKG